MRGAFPPLSLAFPPLSLASPLFLLLLLAKNFSPSREEKYKEGKKRGGKARGKARGKSFFREARGKSFRAKLSPLFLLLFLAKTVFPREKRQEKDIDRERE